MIGTESLANILFPSEILVRVVERAHPDCEAVTIARMITEYDSHRRGLGFKYRQPDFLWIAAGLLGLHLATQPCERPPRDDAVHASLSL